MGTIVHLETNIQSLVGAIIVLYMPDSKLLDRLLSSLVGQVGMIYIIDNTPTKLYGGFLEELHLKKNANIVYHPLGENYGIAKAQNVGIKLAVEGGCDHIVFFDQDSALPKGMMNELLLIEKKLLDDSVNVGVIGPIYIDEKTGNHSNVIRHGRFTVNKIQVTHKDKFPIRADYLISSGSLIRVSVLNSVGLMREDLFIDWVDVEWGMRAGRLGFLNFAVPSVTMIHSIGDSFCMVGKRAFFLHNDIRNYYIVRNACHLLMDCKIDNSWRINIALKIPAWLIFYTLTSEAKLKSFKRLLRACMDGFSGRLGRYLER